MRDGIKASWLLSSAALALCLAGCPTYIVISSDAGVAGTGAAGEAGMSGGAYAGTGYGGAYAGMGYGGAYAGTGYGGVGGYPAGGYGGAGGCGFDPNCGCCPDTHCGTGGSGEPFCVPAPGVYAPCADCARLGESWVDVWVDSNGWIECTILQGQVGCFEHCVQRCDPWFGCVGMGGAGGVGGGPAGMGGVGGGPAGMGGVGGGPADDPARPDGGSADEPAWPDASTPE